MNCNKNINFTLIKVTFLFLFSFSNSYSKGKIYVNFNYTNQEKFITAGNGLEHSYSFSSNKFTGKYFLVRGGLETFSKANSVKITHYKDQGASQSCKLEDNIIKFDHADEDKNILNKKIIAFRKCLKFKITDLSEQELSYEPNSKNDCTVHQLTGNTALVTGGECFFKVKKGSVFNLELDPQKNCADRSFLTRNKITPMNLTGKVEAYFYGTNELGPFFKPLNRLKTQKIDLNINPSEDLIKTAEEYLENDHLVENPDVWTIPNIQITKFNFLKLKKEELN